MSPPSKPPVPAPGQGRAASPCHGTLHHVELWVPDLTRAEATLGRLLRALGYVTTQRWDNGCSLSLGPTYLVIEESADLTASRHDRRAPGLNHLAFHVASAAAMDALVAEAVGYGWTLLFPDRHPHAGGAGHYAAYLESEDGFEVELVAGEPGRAWAEPIRSERLDLLPLGVEHAEEMAGVLDDPALHTFIGGAPLTPAELRARYERLAAGSPEPDVGWLNWVIRVRDEDRLAGTVQATVTDGGACAEIAWVVGTAWQGRGIAGEAARGLVDRLGALAVRTVVAHIHPDHAASAAVARSAGLAPTDVTQDGEIRWRRTMDR